jgi:hypothetical protein
MYSWSHVVAFRYSQLTHVQLKHRRGKHCFGMLATGGIRVLHYERYGRDAHQARCAGARCTAAATMTHRPSAHNSAMLESNTHGCLHPSSRELACHSAVVASSCHPRLRFASLLRAPVQAEFTNLAEWVREKTMFDLISSIGFFKNYLTGRAFSRWKKVCCWSCVLVCWGVYPCVFTLCRLVQVMWC